MDDSVTVQVFDGGANLVYIALNFEFMEPFSSPEQFIQWLILAQLKENINILSIFKEVLKAHDVVVVQRPVDLDFRHELLLCSRFC